jgi:hypothetical protein
MVFDMRQCAPARIGIAGGEFIGERILRRMTIERKTQSLRNKRLMTRGLEALREFGILLLAFAPLESVVNRREIPWVNSTGFWFSLGGLGALMTAWVIEWRWSDVG